MSTDPRYEGALEDRITHQVYFHKDGTCKIEKGDLTQLPCKLVNDVEPESPLVHPIIPMQLNPPPIIHTSVPNTRKYKKDKYKMSSHGLKSFKDLMNEEDQEPPLLTVEESSFSGGVPPALVKSSQLVPDSFKQKMQQINVLHPSDKDQTLNSSLDDDDVEFWERYGVSFKLD